MSGAKILLVEDNEGDARLLREILTNTGIEHELTVLEDGEKAIRFFEKGSHPDLVVLDLKLPKVNGHQIMQFLRERGLCANLKVIIMTGSDSPSDREQARRNGVTCYMVKPMTILEMDRTTEAIKSVLLGIRSCDCTLGK
jgi:CheY-like chemotaxis protein